MSPEKKRQLTADIIMIIALLILLTLVTRLWPILLLMILGLFGYAIWKLFHVEKQPTEVQAPSVPTALIEPVTEQELVTVAFGLFNRRITQHVTAAYPLAKWVYSEASARERFAHGEPLTILLNNAGGYKKALIQVSDLQMIALTYLPDRTENVPEPEPGSEAPDESDTMDYGLLAFEWVEANLQRLNAQANDAAARAESEFRIPAGELPHGDSWPAVCIELNRNGFPFAEPRADGIHVKITTEQE